MLQHEIRRLRKAKGMSQEMLAKEVHITQHALSQYETGRRAVPLETFEQILKVLGVNIQFNLSDETMNRKIMASLFFEKWDEIENRFPEWETFHSGGGIWILRKDFTTKDGKQVMVAVADTGAMLYKKAEADENAPYGVKVLDSFVSYAEFKAQEDFYLNYESEVFEVLFQIGDKEWNYSSIANSLFDKDTLEELEYHADILSKNLESV